MSQDRTLPEPKELTSPDIDLDLIDYLLSLSPAERIRRHDQALELVRALRQAGKRLYGLDPRVPEAVD